MNTNRVNPPAVLTTALQILSSCVRNSALLWRQLLDPHDFNMVPRLREVLAAVENTKTESRHASATFELFSLANDLLPALPAEIAAFVPYASTEIRRYRCGLAF